MSSQILSSEMTPCEPKSVDFALRIAGVWKYARKIYGCGQHWSFEWPRKFTQVVSSAVGDSQI